MSKRSLQAVVVAGAVVAWAATALPDEATDQPATLDQPSPRYSLTELQQLLGKRDAGGAMVVPNMKDWVDPGCTGYGPGLGAGTGLADAFVVMSTPGTPAGDEPAPASPDLPGTSRPASGTAPTPPG